MKCDRSQIASGKLNSCVLQKTTKKKKKLKEMGKTPTTHSAFSCQDLTESEKLHFTKTKVYGALAVPLNLEAFPVCMLGPFSTGAILTGRDFLTMIVLCVGGKHGMHFHTVHVALPCLDFCYF